MSIISEKLKLIKPSPTIAVTTKAAELRAEGKDVIGLGAGEPDFNTPENITEAGIKAIKDGKTRYTPVNGVKELTEAIIAKFKRENNLNYEAKNIAVSGGGKQIIFNALMASLNVSDEVIIPAPYWVSYPDITLIAGGVPKIINTKAENNFKLTATELENAINAKTKWLILNSPSNPTGSAYTESELKALTDILKKHENVYILTDDIYEHIVYDGFEFKTIAGIEPEIFNRTLTLNGVSKAYAMTGWRLGYAGCGNSELIKAMSKIQSQSTTHTSSITQYASIEALNGDQSFLNERNQVFKKRRNMVVDALNKIEGIDCKTPEGAFYVFPSCNKLFGKKTPNANVINNSADFASYLLEDALVAVVAGIAFGDNNHFRISYATSDENLEKAMARISEAVAKLI